MPLYLTTAQLKANARAVMALGYLQAAAKNPYTPAYNLSPDNCRCLIGASLPEDILLSHGNLGVVRLTKQNLVIFEDLDEAGRLQSAHDALLELQLSTGPAHYLSQEVRIAALTALLAE